MKIDLNEIWEFLDSVPEPKNAEQGKHWVYELVAGEIVIQNLRSQDIANLKKEDNYDTELLPSIFTFREILWQPNVYTEPAQCIPQLNILKVFCEEHIAELKENGQNMSWPYFDLLNGLGTYCSQAIEKIAVTEKKKGINIASILGDLRKNAFPIVKFFIFHPMNRNDYQTDALNRLNYAVKIMLTQYNNKYFDLQDPFWNVTIGDANQPMPAKKTAEKPIESVQNEASQIKKSVVPVSNSSSIIAEAPQDFLLEEF